MMFGRFTMHGQDLQPGQSILDQTGREWEFRFGWVPSANNDPRGEVFVRRPGEKRDKAFYPDFFPNLTWSESA